MILVSHLPSEDLQNFIKEYYFIQLEAETKSIPVIDDCSYDLVCFKEGDAQLSYGKPAQFLPINHHLFTIHQLVPPYQIHFKRSLTFFTIKLQPWMNGSLFSGLKSRGIIDISPNIFTSNEFTSEIFKYESTKDMFHRADIEMAAYLPKITKQTDLTRQICLRVLDKRGMISVSDLSKEFEKSRQYLNKIFKQHVLYSLKKYITIVRILDLIKSYSKDNGRSLTELAYEYEYFDQAHFNHDFKQVSGVTPKYFFENLPEFLLRH